MPTVLSVAYPLAAVGPDAAGGAEQVLHALDRALAARPGWRSVVVAREDSAVAGALVPTPRAPEPYTPEVRAAAQAAHRRAVAGALRDLGPVDLVHLHGVDFHATLPPPGVPALATLHLPLSWYPPEALRPARPDTWLHPVSASQVRLGQAGLDHLLPPIPNGVDAAAFGRAPHARRAFALALGRICPEKGFHLALDAAKAAGVPLLLAGQVHAYPEHEAYFRDEIAPRLDRERRFLGPVGLARKRRLLAAARCLLVPSLCDETGSLVAMEALASGTPVVAFPNGALPDVVEDGVTGFLVRDAPAMARAIPEAARLDPGACRAAARGRFSLDATVGRYLATYHALLGRRPAEAA